MAAPASNGSKSVNRGRAPDGFDDSGGIVPIRSAGRPSDRMGTNDRRVELFLLFARIVGLVDVINTARPNKLHL